MSAGDGTTDVRIDASWLTAGGLPKLLPVLESGGEEARAIGGAVRNALLDEPPGDIDVATTATPDDVVRRVTAAGFKAVPTGIAHGTVTVVIDGVPFEVTTLRKDVETDGRHAKVEFGRDWRADAHRRDFTINALSVARDGTVYDYANGLGDLKVRRVRFIGDAAARIAEDYLRILRFFRFHAAYGRGAPDAAAVAACIAGRGGLDQLSRERVRSEILKLLTARGATGALTAMFESGLLLPVLRNVPVVPDAAAMADLESELDMTADAMRRLAALAVLTPEDAGRLGETLRLSNAEQARLAAMADGWWRVLPHLSEHARQVLLYRLKRDAFVDRALLAWARAGAPASDQNWRALVDLPRRWAVPVFPVKAADLMAAGMTPGPALGRALATAEDRWIADGFPGDAASRARLVQSVTGSPQ